MPSPVRAEISDGALDGVGQRLGGVGRPVRLVHDHQLGHAGGADLVEHLAHGRHLALGVRTPSRRRRARGGPPGGPSPASSGRPRPARAGSLRTKPTVSVTSTVSPPGRAKLAGARVERDEEPVGRGHPGVGQAVEQRRLPGVGVADQGQLAMAAAGAAASLQRPGALDLAQVGLEAVHPADQTAPVDLELGLARSPRADAAGLLAERGAPAAQAGQPVAQQRQLDLRLALGAARVLGEDVEDHGGAVDGRAPEELLEVAMLGGRELVVEDHGVGVEAAARARRSPPPCPARRTWPGPGASRRWTTRPTTSAPALSTSSASSSSSSSTDLVGQPREDDADEDDALPEACAR